MELDEIRKKLKKELVKDRYEHTKGVMYTAGALAMAYRYDMKKAMLAGLLHDCAKCIPNKEKIEVCQSHNLAISQAEYDNPTLLHAKAGAIFAREKYQVEDSEVLHAITVHTTGCPNMNLLDKIIFVADYIEPGRDKAPHLEHLRALAFQNLDACVGEILFDTLHYLHDKKGAIDPQSSMTYEFYENYIPKSDFSILEEDV